MENSDRIALYFRFKKQYTYESVLPRPNIWWTNIQRIRDCDISKNWLISIDNLIEHEEVSLKPYYKMWQNHLSHLKLHISYYIYLHGLIKKSNSYCGVENTLWLIFNKRVTNHLSVGTERSGVCVKRLSLELSLLMKGSWHKVAVLVGNILPHILTGGQSSDRIHLLQLHENEDTLTEPDMITVSLSNCFNGDYSSMLRQLKGRCL